MLLLLPPALPEGDALPPRVTAGCAAPLAWCSTSLAQGKASTLILFERTIKPTPPGVVPLPAARAPSAPMGRRAVEQGAGWERAALTDHSCTGPTPRSSAGPGAPLEHVG